ncbi:type IV pilus modification protein PilV [Halioglobus maricola]|uniref:Type IV pilus modification protein PilV n=1 Tax=Halioglobus maricola TaxID=2601894 RepID=A0A5P9NMJ0_9GAMM|nr:type IV pilus modification protein PilV [Halioglobus maricola]QFU76997.1 type IV pilus modification protein PilV [Halioglobus maricola]
MSPAANMHSRHQQKGMTLIEALIAAVILAIGILGIVSLLGISKVAQHDTVQRTRAVSLADDLLERIRRNPEGVSEYINYNPLNGSSAPSIGADCTTTTCSAEDLAKFDLDDWDNLLSGAAVTAPDPNGAASNTAVLPNVAACVNFTADTGKVNTGIVDVVIQWRGLSETFDAADGDTICGTDWSDEEKPYRRQVVIRSFILDEEDLL